MTLHFKLTKNFIAFKSTMHSWKHYKILLSFELELVNNGAINETRPLISENINVSCNKVI